MTEAHAAAPTSVEPKLAATVLLLRDRGGRPEGPLEVFLVERHHLIDFAGGATVFPGGKLHEGDTAPGLRARCRGAEGLSDADLALRVAAIRESLEECGVLLARPRGGSALVSALRLADVWKRYRGEVKAHDVSIAALARDEDLELATDLLVPFAHWITPLGAPKRFDTWFFLVPAPLEQITGHDGHELVGGRWMTPAEALAEADAGRRTIIFPTRMNLAKLARSANVAAAFAAARAARIVTVLPHVEGGPKGPVLRIPAEAGYDVVEAPLEELVQRR
jgi:8-oxo-dGTP pyrophosphatase MutT (NUDIX family)